VPLREPKLLGVPDPRALAQDAPSAQTSSADGGREDATVKPGRRARAERARSTGARATPERTPSPAATPLEATTLGDEARVFLQFMAPKVLRRRLEYVSFELAERFPRVREHQTILAALLWKHVDHQDVEQLRALGELLDDYARDPLSELRGDGKVGANIPYSLKRRVDGAALRLKDTHEHASVRAITSALIWRYVDVDDPGRFDELVSMLSSYDAEAFPKRRAQAATRAA